MNSAPRLALEVSSAKAPPAVKAKLSVAYQRRSIAPKGALVTKHVVHIIFAGDVDGSLESVTSQDEAVRVHRLFALDELAGVVLHPPIQRFLQRWQSGDPAVYLGALWTP